MLTLFISNLYLWLYLDFMVREGGLEPPSANDAEGSEKFDVIDISKLKNIDE